MLILNIIYISNIEYNDQVCIWKNIGNRLVLVISRTSAESVNCTYSAQQAVTLSRRFLERIIHPLYLGIGIDGKTNPI